jgi:hypothetical protein
VPGLSGSSLVQTCSLQEYRHPESPILDSESRNGYLMSPTSQFSKEPLTLGMMLKSDSGQTYKIEEVLADRRKSVLCVYRARCVDLEVM